MAKKATTTKATTKPTTKSKATTKAAKKEEVETLTNKTFTTDSLARAISAKSAVDGKAKFSISDSLELINLFKESVADALKTGQKVQLTGFITINPSYRNEREGNNVLTGDKMVIPASVTFNAKVGKGLKDIAKELPEEIIEEIKNSK